MQQTKLSNQENQITGALWGAILGDVIGAHLQFDHDLNPKKIKNAFQIIGGGKHKLQPGQPTDDSQLMMSVLKGLKRGEGKLNLNLIAVQMGNWYLSKPCDVGATIKNSVTRACNMKQHQAYLCRKSSFQRSMSSQSNGSLMALIGISLWCRKLQPQELILGIRQFTILIHPNQLVVLSNCFYALIIKGLFDSKQDKHIERAFFALNFAKQHLKKYINQQFNNWIICLQKSLQNIKILEQQCGIRKASGWIRVALSYSIHFLLKGKSYKESIQWIISERGDTDTNACIMGGLLGAQFGILDLNMNDQLQKVKKWRTKRRPQWLCPGKVIPEYIQLLINKSPTKLQLIGDSKQYKQNEIKNKNGNEKIKK